MAAEIEKDELPKAKEITFKCRFCETAKSLEEMILLTDYFPLIVACRACEKKMR